MGLRFGLGLRSGGLIESVGLFLIRQWSISVAPVRGMLREIPLVLKALSGKASSYFIAF